MGIEIHGFCDKRFAPLREAFAANFDAGNEIGASVGATHRGKPVVDLWAGWRNLKRTRPWRRNTVVQVYSTTKIPLVMCMLKLVERNKVDLDMPIARYWPEFGQNGKDKVTLRDFLTHRGGVPIFDPPVTNGDLRDWTRITAQLAAQKHRYNGERVSCYHPTTFGFVLGELIRRVDGRDVMRFFRDEFAQKLHADFKIGLSSRWQRRRVADLSVPALKTFEEAMAAAPPGFTPTEEMRRLLEEEYTNLSGNVMTWSRVSTLSPATHGFGNGRSIAQICAVLANGGRHGWRRYLAKQLVEEVAREQYAGEDRFVGPIRWGLGVALDTMVWPSPSPTAFHWGGFGGSWAVIDPKARVSFAYAPNNLLDNSGNIDPRNARFKEALAAVLSELVT